MPKIITVLGATGAQGSSIIAALLPLSHAYHLRALTRNPSSPQALSLASSGVSVIAANLDDPSSLLAALAGSHAIFAVTNFFEPFASSGCDAKLALEVEVQQGKNIVDAACATEGLEHFIWSTLPNGKAVSEGKYVVPHFEGKNQVDGYIRSKTGLLEKTTFLWVTWYAQNYNTPVFTPYEIGTAGMYVQLITHSPETVIWTIGDVRRNLGAFVWAILEQPGKTRGGAIVVADIERLTSDELLQKWAAVHGKKAVSVRVGEDVYKKLWPGWAEELGVMMQFWDEAGDRAWTELGSRVLTRDDLGLEGKDFESLEDALKGLQY